MRVTIKRMDNGRYSVETPDHCYVVGSFANAKHMRKSILSKRKAVIIKVTSTTPYCILQRVRRARKGN